MQQNIQASMLPACLIKMWILHIHETWTAMHSDWVNTQRLTYFDANAADVGLLASGVGQQDVLRFQVAVDDAFAVEDAHGSGDLLEENSQRVLSQRPFS